MCFESVYFGVDCLLEVERPRSHGTAVQTPPLRGGNAQGGGGERRHRSGHPHQVLMCGKERRTKCLVTVYIAALL